jgi:alpha,alpha-trehalase
LVSLGRQDTRRIARGPDRRRGTRLGRAVGAAVGLWLAGLSAVGPSAAAAAQVETPLELYGQLFVDVQLQRVFPDSKTFADAVPNGAPAEILQGYEAERARPGFDLRAFVRRHFSLPRAQGESYRAVPGQDVCDHIDGLWPVLERAPEPVSPYGSLLPLPFPYVVPGGRFAEIYYWDSYFTMLGLEQSGRRTLALDMVRNFASLVDRYGHVPNGNRTYYLSRSQPPFLAAMVELAASTATDADAVREQYLPALSREYAFWMDGADGLAPGSAHRRVVRLSDGTLLNRYWDDRDVPREEAYREDVATAAAATRPPPAVYRDLRAAAESGWDFSSRWLGDGQTLATIRTTDLVPVDLNSVMAQLESSLAAAHAAAGAVVRARALEERAERRKAALQRYFWDEERGMFTDYLWREDKRSDALTAATVAPLFFGLATAPQARRVAAAVRAHLLWPGGLVTSTVASGQQWDAPNGWAPLQWMAIEGLHRYGETDLARTIAERWMTKVITSYRSTGKLVEKYNLADTLVEAGGGEYPTQDGFGWTNGVLRRLLALYPDTVARDARTGWCPSPPANDNDPPERLGHRGKAATAP